MSNTLIDSAEKKAHILHELRTPLNVVLGYAEMILEEAQALPDQTAANVLKKIARAGAIVEDLIQQYVSQLMDDAKDDSSTSRTIVLNKIVDSINQIRGCTVVLKSCGLTTESCGDLDAITTACKKFEDLVCSL